MNTITNNMPYLSAMHEYYAITHWISFTIGTVAFIVMYCCLKFIMGKAIEYVVKNIVRPPSVSINDEKLQLRIRSSFWSFVVYTFLITYELFYMTRIEWVLRPSQYAYIVEKPPAAVFFHYYVEFMHYILALVFLLVEQRGRDFAQMFAHHCLTLFLISVSYRSKLLRYGVVVMAVHDAGDPFLEMAKICKYLNLKIASGVIFMLFSLVFFTLRIVLFPFFVIRSAINSTMLSSDVNWTHCSLTCGLVLLLVINILWMFQIVKVEFDTIIRHCTARHYNVSIKKQK